MPGQVIMQPQISKAKAKLPLHFSKPHCENLIIVNPTRVIHLTLPAQLWEPLASPCMLWLSSSSSVFTPLVGHVTPHNIGPKGSAPQRKLFKVLILMETLSGIFK